MGKRFCGKACRVKNKREIIQLPAVGFIRRPGACFLQENVVQWRKEIKRRTAMIQKVLQIHAEIRPDIFISGTTKYTDEELREMIRNEEKPIYVAADEQDVCVGYAFCQLRSSMICASMKR